MGTSFQAASQSSWLLSSFPEGMTMLFMSLEKMITVELRLNYLLQINHSGLFPDKVQTVLLYSSYVHRSDNTIKAYRTEFF